MADIDALSRGFDHEKLDVYNTTREFVSLTHDIISALPRGKTSLADQLERAAMSIALNTAEGSGEFSRKEKVRFSRMALRSTGECAAIIDVGRRIQGVSPAHEHRGKEFGPDARARHPRPDTRHQRSARSFR